MPSGKKLPTRIREERDTKIVELIRKGVLPKQIAPQFHLTVDSLRQILRRLGVSCAELRRNTQRSTRKGV